MKCKICGISGCEESIGICGPCLDYVDSTGDILLDTCPCGKPSPDEDGFCKECWDKNLSVNVPCCVCNKPNSEGLCYECDEESRRYVSNWEQLKSRGACWKCERLPHMCECVPALPCQEVPF